MNVRVELEKLTGFQQSLDEPIEDYQFRIVEEADKLIGDNEDKWKSLSKECQTWINLFIEKVKDGKTIPPFPEEKKTVKQKTILPRSKRLDPKTTFADKTPLPLNKTVAPIATSVVKYVYEMVALNPDISITEVKQNLNDVGLYATDGTIKGKRNDVRVIIQILMKHGKYRTK